MPNADLIDAKRYETQRSDKETNKAWDDGSVEKLFEAQNLAKTKLKQIVRRGVPDGIRSLVWPEFLKMHKMPDYDRNYTKAVFRVHGPSPPETLAVCPAFGGSLFPEWLCLTAKGYLIAGRLLSILAYDFPHIDYCPFLPVIVALLLHHVGPDDTLGCMNQMIKRTLLAPQIWTTFPTYKRDVKAFNYAFGELVKEKLPKVHRHIEKLNGTDKPLWARWFCDFFVGVLPLDVIFHVLDSFIIEGHKVLMRYALAVLEQRSADVLAAVAWDDVRAIFALQPPKGAPPPPGGVAVLGGTLDTQDHAQGLPSPTSPLPPSVPANVWKGDRAIDMAALVKVAFGYKFAKPKLLEWRNAYHAAKSGGHRDGSLTDLMVSMALGSGTGGGTAGGSIDMPRLLHTEASAFMTPDDWRAVWAWVPARHKVANLEQAFTTRKHGRALPTFYDLCREREPTIMLIEAMDGSVFGAFCPVSWPLAKTDFQKFFGTGETFVFRLRAAGVLKPAVYPWVGAKAGHVAVQNAMHASADAIQGFMYAGPKELIIGGGGFAFLSFH
ncbi:rab-GTPase-TBC domain-containing protein [Blastocladiella britannica]|nr:rab-GTPase-TBC domain-containing protein [Blastocladiella britannica]